MDTKSKKTRIIVSFLAFFIGLNMLFGAAFHVLQTIAYDNGFAKISTAVLPRDYQRLPEFQRLIERKLDCFLAMATGAPIENSEWFDGGYNITAGSDYDYNYDYDYEYEYEYDYRDNGNTVSSEVYIDNVITPAAAATPQIMLNTKSRVLSPSAYAPTEAEILEDAENLHKSMKDDKNLLYVIGYDGKILYSNTTELSLNSSGSDIPQEYSFFLSFKDGKAELVKNGSPLDVYGDGYYRDDASQWYVPGYQNFPTDESAKKATIIMAAATDPQLYIYKSYGNEQNDSYSRRSVLYDVASSLDSTRKYLFRTAIFSLIGLALLIISLIMRKSRKNANAAIANMTRRIPIELKLFTIGLFALIFALDLIMLRMGLPNTLRMLANDAKYRFMLCVFFWMAYLFILDLYYNKKQFKNGIWAKMDKSLQARPFIQRISMRSGLVMLCAVVFSAFVIIVQLFAYWRTNYPFLLGTAGIAAIIASILLMAAYLHAKRIKSLCYDLDLLMHRIEAIKGGNIDARLTLPQGSDLYACAESLNDVQSGIAAAVSEQTKSERMKVELITNVSHDIKTPLTAIISYVQLLKDEEELPAHVKDYVSVLESKSERLKEIVQDVFEISKAAAGQLPVTLERIDLAKLLHQTLADMSEQLEKSPITIRTDIPTKPIMITADGARLYRVFQNLIQNALQYSLDGSRVYLSLEADGKTANTRIKNTSRSELPHSFDFTERFARLDESRTDGGSGLGLSIAKSFAEACGGGFKIETQADLFTATVSFLQKPSDNNTALFNG